MEEQTQHQVMTEIALALAMVFICVMVLALVSVGIQSQQPQLMQIAKQQPALPQSSGPEGNWVIFHKGHFYDTELNAVDPSRLQQGPIWLAVKADLKLQQLISAKQQIFSPDVSIALLDQSWLTRLEELQ